MVDQSKNMKHVKKVDTNYKINKFFSQPRH